jgi:hypothetical protein
MGAGLGSALKFGLGRGVVLAGGGGVGGIYKMKRS